MSRLRLQAAALAVILLCSTSPRPARAGAQAQGQAAPAWQEFSPSEGRFSVKLPSRPVTTTQRVETPDGWLPMRVYTLATPDQYIVSYMDYPRTLEDPARVGQFFAGVRDGALRATGATLLRERDVTLAGHPGRQFKMKLRGGLVGRARIYVVGNRLYQLLFIVHEEGAPELKLRSNEEAADRFFDSFRLEADGPSADRLKADRPTSDRLTAGSPSAEVCSAETAVLAEAGEQGEVSMLLYRLSKLKGERVPLVIGSFADSGAGAARPAGKKVLVGKALSRPMPGYPPDAKAARAQGAVVVQIVVDVEGRVSAVQVLCGHTLLQEAAADAVRQWRFSPTVIDGQPVMVTGVVSVNFKLQ
jgi:TonB family protein